MVRNELINNELSCFAAVPDAVRLQLKSHCPTVYFGKSVRLS